MLGAGAVGTVSALKFVQDAMLEQLVIADAVSARASLLTDRLHDPRVSFRRLDAGDRAAVVNAIRETGTTIVLNAALPATNLEVMRACLAAGCDYIDMASGGTDDDGIPKMDDQFALDAEFKAAGRIALLGMGADPGTTNVYAAYAAKHLLDEVHYVDIVDCNGGSHGKAFATNFNPEINIREITARGRYWENGEWKETDPLSKSKIFDYPGVGERKSYLLYHEELESLAKNLRGLKRIRFWMTFGESYLKHLEVMQNIGITRIDEVEFEGKKIVPMKFLRALLPDPASLAPGIGGARNCCSIPQSAGLKSSGCSSPRSW